QTFRRDCLTQCLLRQLHLHCCLIRHQLRHDTSPEALFQRIRSKMLQLVSSRVGQWQQRRAAVVVAAGCGAFGPNRPPLEGIEAFEESGSVEYLVTRKEEHRGKRVVIAGGGDSALDWVLGLHGVADKIMVVHRRNRFRAAPDSVKRMDALVEAGEVELVVPYQLHGLDGEGGKLQAVIVADLDDNERRLEADLLLPFYGLRMELGPIADWGLNLEKNLIGVEAATCVTSTPGIYGVGDIITYPGKLKLILSGFSETAMAAHAIYDLVYPDKPLHFEYSTTRGVPGD
ncbi:MAG: NAD(P)/FAD-dependent oxidoreductase, partial [Rhodospirillaceae bacterium]|nr:NAD(P)/FAD-dependent oxidoreductase [Rhodospirillaceae bacterium]